MATSIVYSFLNLYHDHFFRWWNLITLVWLGKIWRPWWQDPGCPRNRWKGASGRNQCCPSSCWETRTSKTMNWNKRGFCGNLERQSTTSPDARTASTPSTEPCRLPYLHFTQKWFQLGHNLASSWRFMKPIQQFQQSCLSKRKPPALVLTLPPIWQLPCENKSWESLSWQILSTFAPRSKGTIIPWSAKTESSVSRTTPAWTYNWGRLIIAGVSWMFFIFNFSSELYTWQTATPALGSTLSMLVISPVDITTLEFNLYKINYLHLPNWPHQIQERCLPQGQCCLPGNGLVNCPTRQFLSLSIGSLHWLSRLSRFPYPDNKEI